MPRRANIRVWDLGVRLFHWGLLAAILVSAITGFVLDLTMLAWHLLAGEMVAMLLAWRMVWGFSGSGPARFRSFAFSPRAVLAYAGAVARGRAGRHLGHNPLGAMMVFAMLAMLAAIVATGVLTLGGLLKQGPLKAFLHYDLGQQGLRVHNVLAIMLLAMIAAHVAGVVFESWRERHFLAHSMVTGDKPDFPAADVLAVARPRAGLALGLTALMVLGGGAAVMGLARLPGLGAPPATMDPVFAAQCGACHLAFPPSLAPAATWQAITDDLMHHFGADASLSAEQVAHIRGWLVANAAEHWDTLPSHRLRMAGRAPRITDAPGWKKIHRDIANSIFAANPIYRRSDCAACHADADSGGFAPQHIAIPALVPASGR